jgi:hypothetical protein
MKKNQKLIREDLHKELIQFYKACIKLKSQSKIPHELEEIIEKHYSKVTRIISDFRINDIKASMGKGRPKNQEARNYFEKQITKYQNENKTLGFPKKEDFFEELQNENIKRQKDGKRNILLSERAYDDFIKEWKEGFFNLNT